MKRALSRIVLFTGMFCFYCSISVAATTSDLVSVLVSQLGVSQEQAEGGAGAVFKTAKDSLGVDEYTSLTTAMPEIQDYVEKAPVVKKESSGWMSSASSLLGDTGKKAESATSLVKSFESLGLSGDMVTKFTPIIMDYAETNGGDICVNILKSVL